MSFLNRAYKLLTAEHTLILLAILVAAVFLMQYSSLKNTVVGAMTNGNKESNGNNKKSKNGNGNGMQMVKPAMASGNSGPGPASGPGTMVGLPKSCAAKAVANPSDLLPQGSNNDWNELNPSGGGELGNVNLLKAGYHAGIDTIGSSLRNANLQVRSEPPNPKSDVSPWLNSTIEPDLMRAPLEIGCGPQICQR
jgi:hypothetical protein